VHDTELEIVKNILTQSKDRLCEELSTLGFNVTGSVYSSPSEPPYSTMILLTASLKWTTADEYGLVPPDPKAIGECDEDDHTWLEKTDKDGEPYDVCLTCNKVEFL
jgi:hypothetical protein